jgi:gliding motility-associated-like protein
MTVTSTNTCQPIPKTVNTTIVVRPTLLPTMTAAQTVCQNLSAPVVFKATQGILPYTFTYTEAVTGGFPATQTANITSGSSATKQAPTGTPGTVVYNLVSVQDANCTKQLAAAPQTQTVTVNPLPDANISQDEEVCRDSVAKNLIFTGSIGKKPYTYTFTINNGNSVQTKGDTVTVTPPSTKPGTYVYTLTQVKDANGCIEPLSKKATVTVYENPQARFTVSPQQASILRPTISISDASVSTQLWNWNFGDGNTSPSSDVTEYTYKDTGTYTIKLIVSNAICTDSTTEKVRIILPTLLYVPNTFSPNGDGVNDVFKAEGDGITTFEMMVFDRWGQMVFYSNDINKGWDGKANGGSEVAQLDTYVYVINLRALANKHDYTYRGTISLIK